MQSLKIALVQTSQIWEDIDANLAHFETKLKEVESTDLILLPEMFSTSFTMRTDLAENWEKSTTKNWLLNQAKQRQAAIYTSYIVEEKGQFYNRGIFVEPNGNIHTYDKRKCFSLAKEDEHFTAGSTTTILAYKGWNIQLNICYDLRFPEILRNHWNKETKTPAYDILLFVANWPERRVAHWSALLKARAIENQCFVLGLNRTGLDGNEFAYNGQSAAVDALGEYLTTPDGLDEIKYIVLKMNELQETRTRIPFLKDQA